MIIDRITDEILKNQQIKLVQKYIRFFKTIKYFINQTKSEKLCETIYYGVVQIKKIPHFGGLFFNFGSGQFYQVTFDSILPRMYNYQYIP